MTNDIPQFGEKIPGCIDRPGAYAVILKNDMLLAIEKPDGYFLPGGGIDPGETKEIALLREIFEETGHQGKIISYLGVANQYVQSHKYGAINKKCHYFICEVDTNYQERPLEEDDVPVWVPTSKYLAKSPQKSHTWAVKKFLEQ